MNTLPEAFADTGPVPCAEHPNIETRLRCSRCGRPICPRCAVRTPVGMRCPDCAGTRATVVANPAGTLRAALAGLAVATAVGVGWALLPSWGFYWALLLGFGVVETMVWLLRARRGTDLQAIAIAIVVYGVLLSRVILAQRIGFNLGDISSFGPHVQRALFLRPIPDLFFMAIALVIAWIRFR
jgi:B-box zinc finger